MDLNQFRENGYEMVDYVVDYIESVSQRRVSSDAPPGYLISALPSMPPYKGEPFQKIMEDVEKYIMPGLIHCQHSGFHGYFPLSGSYPSVIANMLADIFSLDAMDWDYSPASSELEIILTNWFGEMIGLPDCFLNLGNRNRGSGLMQRSTNECLFLCMVTARRSVLKRLLHLNPSVSRAALLSSLVVYCSNHSESSIEKIAFTCLVNVRVLDTDENNQLRGTTLVKALDADKKIGMIPFFVNIAIGTFSNGSSDPVREIGRICDRYGLWLNVDAAYGGCSLLCPEYSHLLDGIGFASSFIVTPPYALLIHVDTSLMFVRDRFLLKNSVVIDRFMRGYNFDEKDWSYPCKTEYHSLKYFFVLRMYGVAGLQRHVRNQFRLAERFRDCVKGDKLFEFLSCNFGIVCFRLKASDEANRQMLKSINRSGKLFMTPTRIGGKYTLRFVVGRERACESDIDFAWKVIHEEAVKQLQEGPKPIKLDSFERREEMYKYNFT